MPRAHRVAVWLAVAVTAAAICVADSAAASTPRGTLTAAEYKQLTLATAALNKSASASSIDWTKARAACGHVGRTTALLRTQRSTCFGSVDVLDALASFPAEERACPQSTDTSTGTTTTSTTATTTGTTTSPTILTTPVTTRTTETAGTTPAEATAIQVMICMNPHYQALRHDAETIDRADIAARTQVLDRGFKGACLEALAPTLADLRVAKRFAAATAKLAADVTLLIRVTEGKLPAGDFNQARVDDDVKLFEDSATAVLVEHGQPKLSVCPHQ